MKVLHFGADPQGPELLVSDYQLLSGSLLNHLLETISDIIGLEFLQWED